MFLLDVLREGGLPAVLILILGVLALLNGLVSGLLVALKKRVPPAVVLVPLAGVAVMATLSFALFDADAARAMSNAPAEMKQTLLAASIAGAMGTGLAASLVMVGAGVAGVWVGMVIAFRQEKRAWGMALFGAAVLIAATLAPFLGLIDEVWVGYAALRAGLVALLVLPVSLTLAATDEPGRLAGVTAAGVACLAIIGGIALEATVQAGEVFRAVAHAPADAKESVLLHGLAQVQTIAWWGAIPIALGLLLTVVAAARVVDKRSRLGVMVGVAAVGLSLTLVWSDLPGMMAMVIR